MFPDLFFGVFIGSSHAAYILDAAITFLSDSSRKNCKKLPEKVCAGTAGSFRLILVGLTGWPATQYPSIQKIDSLFVKLTCRNWRHFQTSVMCLKSPKIRHTLFQFRGRGRYKCLKRSALFVNVFLPDAQIGLFSVHEYAIPIWPKVEFPNQMFIRLVNVSCIINVRIH